MRAVGQIEAVFTMAISWLYFREQVTALELVGIVVTVAGVAGVHVAHRLCGVAVALFALAAALRLGRERPRLAWSIGTVVVVALALGLAAVSPQPALAVVVAHNASAAGLVALLASVVAAPFGRPPLGSTPSST